MGNNQAILHKANIMDNNLDLMDNHHENQINWDNNLQQGQYGHQPPQNQ